MQACHEEKSIWRNGCTRELVTKQHQRKLKTGQDTEESRGRVESGRPRTGPAGCRAAIAVRVCFLWGPILTSGFLRALKWAFLGALAFVEPAVPTQLISALPLESRAVVVVPHTSAVEMAPSTVETDRA